MHKLLVAIISALVLSVPGPLFAEDERAGDFDYYILSLGWSPSWCATDGRRPRC